MKLIRKLQHRWRWGSFSFVICPRCHAYVAVNDVVSFEAHLQWHDLLRERAHGR